MSDPAAFADLLADRESWRAAVSLTVLGASTSLLGCVLVARRLALLGDVLAHAMLPGVGVAWLLVGVSVPALLCGGLVAGLVTAIGSGLISRLTRVKEDAAFAAMFATMFAAGLVLADLGGGSEALLHLLVGDIAGIGRSDAVLAITVGGVTLLAFATGYRAILLECFDPVFHRASGGRGPWIHLGLLALVVLNLVASLRALGAVLAVGMFMLPAVTASLWSRRWLGMLGLSAAIAVGGALLGLVLGRALGAAAGPMIVAVLGAAFVLSMVLSPVNGLIGRSRAAKHHREESDDWCESPQVPPGG
jgi:zinc/manganese transport system permease protein